MRGHLALVLLIGLAALALAGCGGGSSTQTSSGQAETGGAGGGGQSHYEGGEESIEDFGSEARGSDRAAVLAVFTGYLGALAVRNDATACHYIAASVQRSLRRFAPPSLKAKGCPAILPTLLSPTASAIAHQQATGHITKVRIEGDRGFVVFHAPGAKLYQLTMVRQTREWKAATAAASVLVPSAALGQSKEKHP